jgi:hypothetical protein
VIGIGANVQMDLDPMHGIVRNRAPTGVVWFVGVYKYFDRSSNSQTPHPLSHSLFPKPSMRHSHESCAFFEKATAKQNVCLLPFLHCSK